MAPGGRGERGGGEGEKKKIYKPHTSPSIEEAVW